MRDRFRLEVSSTLKDLIRKLNNLKPHEKVINTSFKPFEYAALIEKEISAQEIAEIATRKKVRDDAWINKVKQEMANQ